MSIREDDHAEKRHEAQSRHRQSHDRAEAAECGCAYYDPRNAAFLKANLHRQGPHSAGDTSATCTTTSACVKAVDESRGPRAQSISTTKASRRTPSWSMPPIRASTSASTGGSISGGSSRRALRTPLCSCAGPVWRKPGSATNATSFHERDRLRAHLPRSRGRPRARRRSKAAAFAPLMSRARRPPDWRKSILLPLLRVSSAAPRPPARGHHHRPLQARAILRHRRGLH